MPWKKKDVKKGNKQQGRNHILNWVGVQGGCLFLENFGKFQGGVPNFWVLLHFYALISKNFQILVGLRGGTRPRHQSPGGGLSPPVPPQNNVRFETR